MTDLARPARLRALGQWRAVVPPSSAGVAAFCEGGALGWVAWRPDGPVALIALLPFLWALQRSRGAAGWVWFGYFLAGTRDMPSVVARFFPREPWAFGILLWILDAMILALPWVLLRPKDEATSASVSVRATLAMVLFTVPPIGCLAWLSPLLAGGVLFPGWGWGGVAGTVALLTLLAVVGHTLRLGRVARLRIRMLPVVGLMTAAAAANLAFRPPSAPEGWLALDTHFGRFPTDPHAAFRRQTDLMQIAAEAIQAGAKVVILPEEVAGTWRTAVQYWWRPIDELAARHGATVLVGADVPVAPDLVEGATPRFTNSLVMLGTTRGQVGARVPIPIGLWRPWSQSGAVGDIGGYGVAEVQGRRAAVLICYEELLAWPVLLSFLHRPRPEVLIGAANHWFFEGIGPLWIKRRSSELWGRLFGVPSVRAVNTTA